MAGPACHSGRVAAAAAGASGDCASHIATAALAAADNGAFEIKVDITGFGMSVLPEGRSELLLSPGKQYRRPPAKSL